MRNAMAAEWVKLWSVRSTWLCLAGAVIVTVLGGLTLGGAQATEALREGVAGARVVVTDPVISATAFAQYAVITLAMLLVTSEYASGSIRGTLQVVPIRGRVLAAKALVVAPVMFAAGVLSGGVAALVTHLVLSSDTFGGLAAFPPGEAVADLLRLGVFCALTGVLTVGVSVAVRGSAGALTAMFLLTMGLPLMLAMTGSQVALDVSMRLPTFAGLAFMESTENMTGGPIPYPALEGLAWLTGWTALALVAGQVVLRRRDA
ncbi:ABC transporter permease [Nonomuraea sp. SBT364]|uniref:ABC transporter permease n=1 Tax=Nonomuraea sp. SBT364 TaxID=1580530 RepID=UPI0007C76401|nr:ABC transporter permease [Nonomuraea sp. SBT364]